MNIIKHNDLEVDYSTKDEMITSVSSGDEILGVCPGDVEAEESFRFTQSIIMLISFIIVIIEYSLNEEQIDLFLHVAEDFAIIYLVLNVLWNLIKRKKMTDLLIIGRENVYVLTGIYKTRKDGRFSYEKAFILDRKNIKKKFFLWPGLSFEVKGFIKVKLIQYFLNPGKLYGPLGIKASRAKHLLFK